jgi:hypothetical protein
VPRGEFFAVRMVSEDAVPVAGFGLMDAVTRDGTPLTDSVTPAVKPEARAIAIV